jgi:hypothetical protein
MMMLGIVVNIRVIDLMLQRSGQRQENAKKTALQRRHRGVTKTLQ